MQVLSLIVKVLLTGIIGTFPYPDGLPTNIDHLECPELPTYTLSITDQFGNVAEVTHESYVENDTLTIESHTEFNFIFQTHSRSELKLIEFSTPSNYTIQSGVSCIVPEDASSVIFNTGNPYLTGRRYSKSANPADATGLKKIILVGDLKTGTSGAHFSFLIKLRSGPGPHGEVCEVFHEVHFITN